MNDNLRLMIDGGGQRAERSDAVANRERILETAERLFAEQGVADVNMAQIAQEAEVGKGTLYRRFSNKGELCLSLLDSHLRRFQDEQLIAMRRMAEAGEPYLEQLVRFLEALVVFTERHMPLLCEIQQYSETLDEEHIERPHFWQYLTVHRLLERAQAGGEVPGSLDVAFTAEALLAVLNAPTLRFQRQQLGFSGERISAGLRELVLALQQR